MDWGVVIEILAYCLIGGMIAGIGAGLFGLGGGLTTVPILNYLLPLADVPHAALMHCALAASLVLILINTSAAAYKRWRSDELDMKVLRSLMLPLGLGAVAGAVLADLVDTQILRIFFLLVVLNSLRSSIQGLVGAAGGKGNSLPLNPLTARLMAGLTGTAGALGGTGAGTIMVPFLSRRGFTMKQAGAQAAGLSVTIGLVGSIAYVIVGLNETGMPALSFGYLYLPALLGLAIGGLAAAPYGVRLSQRLAEGPLRWAFLATLLVILAAMLLKTFGIT
ncbi:MAG: sulfite exporter TauE/SafE family protein [Rhodospirillales bacterium]